MPDSVGLAPLAPQHERFWLEHYSDSDEQEFVARVCNRGMVLPESKIDGNPWHMPCTWLGDEERRAFLKEQRLEQDRRRLGWRRVQYLVVVPYPREADFDRHLGCTPDDDAGQLMRDELRRAGIDLREVVVTYVNRFQLPRAVRKYGDRHRKDNLRFLQEDIRQIDPRVIIACGADSLKALFGRAIKLDSVRGDVLDYEQDGDTYKVIPTVSHLAFLGGHANISVFRHELCRAVRIANQAAAPQQAETDYRHLTTVEEVEALCEEIRASGTKKIAFDTEYGNSLAREEHTYLLSLQLSWAPGKAAFIQLRDQRQLPEPEIELPGFFEWLDQPDLSGYKRPQLIRNKIEKDDKLGDPARKKYGDWCRRQRLRALGTEGKDYDVMVGDIRWRTGLPMHEPEEERRILAAVQELLLDRRWRVCGQHMRADFEQMARAGFPIDERLEDGEDTMLKHHLLYGDEDQGLDHLVRKYRPEVGAYWRELEEWLDANCRQKRLRFGYRDIPLSILVPYAQRDADITWQVDECIEEELVKEPHLWRLYHNHMAPTSLVLMEIERQGLLVDEERRMELHNAYKPVYDDLLARVRAAINWPDFNPRSHDQMASLLFHRWKYRDKKVYKWSDGSQHWLPEGAAGLGLRPLMTTDKYPRSWDEVVAREAESMNSPATKAGVLELLYRQHPEVTTLRWLKHLSVIGKFLGDYLSPQVVNEFGVPADGRGFHNNIWRDGRVRTHLGQLTQTGRYTSSKANLQTKPKKQESAAFEALVDYYFGCSVHEYKKRCVEGYEGDDRIAPRDQISVPKYASIFISRPGYCLVEADFKSAELYTWAYCSGDKGLIEVMEWSRNLHAEVAADSFQLPMYGELQGLLKQLYDGDRAPYDNWVERLKDEYPGLYTSAKSVNFGIAYGRSAGALAVEINKVVDEPVTADDTQQIIDSIADRFPAAWEWLESNAEFAVRNEYIPDAFGHRRYFQGASLMNEWDQAAVRREAKNSPIQGTVAQLLSQAGVMLYRFLKQTERGRRLDMRILLPIHDAFLFEVKIEDVRAAVKLIIMCMSTLNKFPGTERYLHLDIEIFPQRWSDKGYNPGKLGDLDKFFERMGLAA